MVKKQPYTVTIRTKAGTTIRLTNPPATLPEMLTFVQDIELAEIKARLNGPEPVPPVPAEVQEKEQAALLDEPGPRQSRFVSEF